MGSTNLPPISVPTDPAVLGYLAGLLDGEGSVIVTRTRGRGSVNDSVSARVIITNTDLPLIEWLLAEVGGSFVPKKRMKDHHRQAYQWLLGGRNAAAFLLAVIPYLRIKKAQAEAGLRILETVGDRNTRLTDEVMEIREEAFAEVRRLNAGQVVA
jgi:sulfite reductase beta subunit-like hemoprotein